MTQRKIATAVNAIEASKKSGHALEALLKNYHLNLDVIKFILLSAKPGYSFEGKKLKTLTKEFSAEIGVNHGLKAIINKKTFRIVKTWLDKMELFFKQLKLEQPGNTKPLLSETEKIFAVLNISANKLFAGKKA